MQSSGDARVMMKSCDDGLLYENNISGWVMRMRLRLHNTGLPGKTFRIRFNTNEKMGGFCYVLRNISSQLMKRLKHFIL
jgi:hypothetical protein